MLNYDYENITSPQRKIKGKIEIPEIAFNSIGTTMGQGSVTIDNAAIAISSINLTGNTFTDFSAVKVFVSIPAAGTRLLERKRGGNEPRTCCCLHAESSRS